ncbi:MAG: hypothetical protein ACO3EZ_10755 [Prochlorotrichaceae cyanobacterium]|jgi:hypothetical protein
MNTPIKLNSPPKLIQSQPPVLAQVNVVQLVQDNPWLGLSSALCIALLGSILAYRLQIRKVNRQVRFEQYKNQELTRKLKLALNTISQMEKNPDLVASREFNLDYLRMRMEEEHFNNAIMEQIRAKIKDKVAAILRPKQTDMGIGVAIPGRHVDTILDVSYAPRDRPEERKVLFRVQVKLVKIPTQPSSQTIAQLIDCVEHYIKPTDEDEYWQPTVQGRLLTMEWDQKAKPTPLLVLEQGQEGGNVVFNTRKKIRHS